MTFYSLRRRLITLITIQITIHLFASIKCGILFTAFQRLFRWFFKQARKWVTKFNLWLSFAESSLRVRRRTVVETSINWHDVTPTCRIASTIKFERNPIFFSMAAPEVSVSWLRAAVEKKGKLLVSKDKIEREAVGPYVDTFPPPIIQIS